MKTTSRDIMARFLRVSRLRHSIAEANVEKLGCHQAQHFLLVTLEQADRLPVSQKEIAKKLQVTPAAVTMAVRKLEKAGLISREISPLDSRVNNVNLTEKGRDVLAKAKLMFDETDGKMLAGLNESEIETLCRILDKMQANLEAMKA